MPSPKIKLREVPIDELAADPENVREHSEENLAAIESSLREFGQQKPIVIDKAGRVIAGNGLLEAAKRIGLKSLIAVQTDLDPTRARAFGIADNRTGELSTWNESALVAALNELKASDEALFAATGFSNESLADLLKCQGTGEDPGEGGYREQYGVIVVCRDEAHQRETYEALHAAGHECRVVCT